MLSVRSIMIFFSVPDGVSFTYPSGTRDSLSHIFLRSCARTWNVALWEQVVETLWNTTRAVQNTAMISPSVRYLCQSLTPATSARIISAMTK